VPNQDLKFVLTKLRTARSLNLLILLATMQLLLPTPITSGPNRSTSKSVALVQMLMEVAMPVTLLHVVVAKLDAVVVACKAAALAARPTSQRMLVEVAFSREVASPVQ